jgi:peptide/nickel transport system substrate-binding protein
VLSATIDTGASSTYSLHELISQGFTSLDQNGVPVPRLLSEIPSLDRGTWRMAADGSMATTYRLRDALYWHDGTSITVEDVAFTLRVYQSPGVPVLARVVSAMDRIEKIDDRSFEVTWRQPYSFADRLTFREFTILPSHILEATFDQDVNAFVNAPYWGDGFVGAGPYRVQSWTRGSEIDLGAFDQYFLGRPKIDRMIVRFIPDANTMGAQVLAGELDMVLQGLDPNRAAELQPMLQQGGKGQVAQAPNTYRHWTFQYANNPTAAPLRDVRVRRAMTHALDREELASFVTAGLGHAVDSWIPAEEPRYRDADPFIAKYPYDPARAQELFQEAGWSRGGDGVLRDARGQQLQCEIRGAGNVGSLGAQRWKAAGIDVSEAAIPDNLRRDAAWRATFPCVEESGRPLGLAVYTHLQSSNVMSAENGWRGTSRSGWSDPELDRAIDRFLTSPLEGDRLDAERQMVRIATTELPLIPIYIEMSVTFIGPGVTGWQGQKRGLLPDTSESWNAHTWERR